MAIGTGRFSYETEEGWAKIPAGYEFPDASGVTVDSEDNVYILNRGPHPVIVIDKDGNVVRSWGEGEFDARAHGIFASHDSRQGILLPGALWFVSAARNAKNP